jgi:hypothetical protein
MKTSKSNMLGFWLVLAAATLAGSSCVKDKPESSGHDGGGVASAPFKPEKSPRAEKVTNAKTMREILNALADDCYACAEKSGCLDLKQQGGNCDGLTGTAKGGRTESEQCLETLRCVFTSKCANNGEQSACLCGATDIVDCMEGKQAPAGTCVAVYKDDFGSNGKAMYDQFLDRNFGSGNANAIIQCVIPMCPSCRIR